MGQIPGFLLLYSIILILFTIFIDHVTSVEAILNEDRSLYTATNSDVGHFKAGTDVLSRRRKLLEMDDDVKAALERAQYTENKTSSQSSSDNEESLEIWSEVVSMSPRLLHIHNVIWPEEREHLISLGESYMQRSTVVGAGGKSVVDNVRTSKGTFLARLHDPIIKRIEERISRISMVPVENGEDIQLLQYEIGEEYKRHPDYFTNINPVDGDQRHVTVLMYLTDVEEGGETIFPRGTWVSDSLKEKFDGTEANGFTNSLGVKLSPCASRDNQDRGSTQQGIYVKPAAGDAVLFYSLLPDNKEDPASLHASCPVIRGTKWSATIWMHVNPFRVADYAIRQSNYERNLEKDVEEIIAKRQLSSDSALCKDHSSKCRDWTLAGDCFNHINLSTIVCCASCSIFRNVGNADVADTNLRRELEKLPVIEAD